MGGFWGETDMTDMTVLCGGEAWEDSLGCEIVAYFGGVPPLTLEG